MILLALGPDSIVCILIIGHFLPGQDMRNKQASSRHVKSAPEGHGTKSNYLALVGQSGIPGHGTVGELRALRTRD
jgi:hypothetical protein